MKSEYEIGRMIRTHDMHNDVDNLTIGCGMRCCGFLGCLVL